MACWLVGGGGRDKSIPSLPEQKGTHNHVQPYKLHHPLRLLDTATATSVAYRAVSRAIVHYVHARSRINTS
jgi:hypothetical protein